MSTNARNYSSIHVMRVIKDKSETCRCAQHIVRDSSKMSGALCVTRHPGNRTSEMCGRGRFYGPTHSNQTLISISNPFKMQTSVTLETPVIHVSPVTPVLASWLISLKSPLDWIDCRWLVPPHAVPSATRAAALPRALRGSPFSVLRSPSCRETLKLCK